MMSREPAFLVVAGDVPKQGLAVNPWTRLAYRDGKRIGTVTGFAPLEDGSPHGWLSVDLDD